MQNKSLDDFFSLNNKKKKNTFSKILSFLIIKILKNNEIIKENVISEFSFGYENNDKNETTLELAKRIAFDNINAGDIILAGTPNYQENDLSHFYRPFLVLGKEDDKIYALYNTSKIKYKDNEKYYEVCNLGNNGKHSYINCSNIYIITIDLFKNLILKYNVDSINEKMLINILNKTMLYGDFLNYIDYKHLNFKIEKGSIVKVDSNFYLVTKILQSENCYITNLLVRRKNEDDYINIFGKKYVLERDKYRLSSNAIDYCITKIDLNNYVKYYKNNEKIVDKKVKKVINKSACYDFGDILSLKDSKNKIIFLAKNNDSIYYIDYDQLDLFIKIKNINKKKINGLYRKLTEDEFNKLINKLNKPMIDDRIYYVPSKVKDEIENHCIKR